MLFKTSREITVSVPIHQITNPDLERFIYDTVVSRIVSLHDGTGIILSGTVRLISRSPLVQDTLCFDGSYKCHVRYSATCADAPKGTRFLTEVQSMLPNGIIATTTSSKMKTPVFRVFLPYALHDDDSIKAIQTLIKGDMIRVNSVGRTGGLGDSPILVLARFVEKVDKKSGEVLPIIPSTAIATRTHPPHSSVVKEFTPEYFRPEPIHDVDEVQQPLPPKSMEQVEMNDLPNIEFEEIPVGAEAAATRLRRD